MGLVGKAKTAYPATMADEKKQIATLAESQLSRSSDDEGQEVAPWTEAEEQALVRRYIIMLSSVQKST